MPDGQLMSDALYSQIGETVRRVRRIDRTFSESDTSQTKKLGSRFPIRSVILDEALAASTFLVPTKGKATVCRWSVENEEYKQTELQLTVFNHSTAEELAADTPGAAIFIDGHYWFFADCEPLSSRPTPPWDESA